MIKDGVYLSEDFTVQALLNYKQEDMDKEMEESCGKKGRKNLQSSRCDDSDEEKIVDDNDLDKDLEPEQNE